ncbi:MAG: hypothetical protein CM15mV128_210 [Caudoviricetes sp.]|nr:MAG: hypothetical protein CM15mV128_210 [Caudoviricetes sp.]
MLKQFAGLLNEVAPQGEFLAYINDDEAKMLQDEGGMGILTEAGIPSYRSARAQSSRTGGSSRTGSSSARERELLVTGVRCKTVCSKNHTISKRR